MTTPTEKEAFASRLKLALTRSRKRINTPLELSIQFNLLYEGEAITPQAAQKWLAGKSQPTKDKIETLSKLLNVSPQWLRFGIGEQRPQISRREASSLGTTTQSVAPTAVELAILAKYRILSAHQQTLIVELIEQLALDHLMWTE